MDLLFRHTAIWMLDQDEALDFTPKVERSAQHWSYLTLKDE